jgi:hypothetical protein
VVPTPASPTPPRSTTCAASASPPSSCCRSCWVDEAFLAAKGLTNYWGYNSVGFFAPAPHLAHDRSPGGATREFKAMVKALHAAGLEVILDVVYNHTAEGNHLGPTLSFRGIDNLPTTSWNPTNAATTST